MSTFSDSSNNSTPKSRNEPLTHDSSSVHRHNEEIENYPLAYPERIRSWDYWPAVLFVAVLLGSIPISFIYVGWYAILGHTQSEITSVWSKIFKVYAYVEIGFTIYQLTLAKSVQSPAPPSSRTTEECLGSLLRVMNTGLNGSEYGQEGDSRVVRTAGQKSETLAPASNKERIDTPDRTMTGSPIFKRMDKEDPRAVEFRERLRNWFGRIPVEHVTAYDIRSWLAWSSSGISYETALQSPEKVQLIEQSLKMLEARAGWTFPRIVNENSVTEEERKRKAQIETRAKIMRLTMDPVNVVPRPLWWYVWLWLGEKLALWFIYDNWGLKRYKEGNMEYLVRIPKGWKPEHLLAKSDPIVFIHGLGFGSISLQNMAVIRKLCKTLSSHPLLIPIQPHVGQQIFHSRFLEPDRRKQFVHDIERACARWGFYNKDGLVTQIEQAVPEQIKEAAMQLDHLDDPRKNGGIVLLSHSNGSVGHAWLLKDKPWMTKRNALVDPIVFCSWEGDLCYNFCYRKPYTGLEILLKYLIATELGIAHTVQRHFDWTMNTLFFDDVPDAMDSERTLFVLGGKDIIVNAQRVKKYLNSHGIIEGVQYDPNKGHSDGLRGSSLDRLMIWLATGKSVEIGSQNGHPAS